MSRWNTNEYEIIVTIRDDGSYMVQVAGKPYPLGMYKESGDFLDILLHEAKDVIISYHWGTD